VPFKVPPPSFPLFGRVRACKVRQQSQQVRVVQRYILPSTSHTTTNSSRSTVPKSRPCPAHFSAPPFHFHFHFCFHFLLSLPPSSHPSIPTIRPFETLAACISSAYYSTSALSTALTTTARIFLPSTVERSSVSYRLVLSRLAPSHITTPSNLSNQYSSGSLELSLRRHTTSTLLPSQSRILAARSDLKNAKTHEDTRSRQIGLDHHLLTPSTRSWCR
jgi:hypothetical protein